MTNHVEAGSTTFHNIISIYIYIYTINYPRSARIFGHCSNVTMRVFPQGMLQEIKHALRLCLWPIYLGLMMESGAEIPAIETNIKFYCQFLYMFIVRMMSCDMELVLFSCVCHERNGATTHIMNIMTKFLVYSGNKGSPFFCMFSRFLFSTL